MTFRKQIGILLLLCALLLCGYAPKNEADDHPEEKQGQIYLYGEAHADDRCMEKELAIWGEFYADGMRDLFIEHPCYTAEYLNQWMHADSDEILYQLYSDWRGSIIHTERVLDFYRTIKEQYPETVFHGTDVGHSYGSAGARFLSELRKAGQADSPEFALAQEIVKQGKTYFSMVWNENPDSEAYRENCMAENFIREFEKLSGKSVMGIYGALHTDPEITETSGRVGSMAKQLSAVYGDILHTENLNHRDPIRTDRITVSGKEYEATYFGSQEFQGDEQIVQWEFWRLEDAYRDFLTCPLTGGVLPCVYYPFRVEAGQIFVIDYTFADGTVQRRYYCSDGYVWNGFPSTFGINPEA